ncbi:MAG TPA: MerR family DNA-binding transcriptional regulator [Hyphomicrobiaceae bacterium]|nr:MerR family DNA-binding transcriptional regulator [Hyphomicrobiaceae bacterium]
MADAPTPESGEERLYTIGELAREYELTTRAIRFYEAKGLISPRRKGSSRAYDKRDRARLTLVLRGKNLGFSLEEIKEYLELYDADATQTLQLKHLLDKVDRRMEELRQKRTDLDRTLRELKNIRTQALAALKRSRSSSR